MAGKNPYLMVVLGDFNAKPTLDILMAARILKDQKFTF